MRTLFRTVSYFRINKMQIPVFSRCCNPHFCDELWNLLCFTSSVIDSQVLNVIFGSYFINARDSHADYLKTKISSCMNDFKIKVKTYPLGSIGNVPNLFVSEFYFIVIFTFHENQLLKVFG